MINRQSWQRLGIALGFALSAFVLMWAIEPPEPFGYSATSWIIVATLTAFIFFAILRLQEIERQLAVKQQQSDWYKSQSQLSHVKLRDGNKW